jgi:DNA polymerase III delta prime subunit
MIQIVQDNSGVDGSFFDENLLKRKIILNHVFDRAKVSSKTRVLVLEGFPPLWGDVLISTVSDFFPHSYVFQTNLSTHGIHALSRIDLEKYGSLVVVIDNLNGSLGDSSAVQFKDMLYAHQKIHFVIMTRQSTGGWNIPNQFGVVQMLASQEEIAREINAFPLSTSEEKQELLLSASPSDFELVRFAEKIQPKYSLPDLVLSPSTQYQFTEILNATQQKLNGRYHSIWKSKHSRGHGVILLFYGKSGTGKTMAAEVVAQSLGCPLYRVNYSKVQSKYIGETEKNLESIFKAAQGVKGVLLFDEGESLFAKRTETVSSNDRFANQEVGYLLQAIERYEGVVIVNTNHDQELDPAFLRRFTRTLRFISSSNLDVQKKLWASILPPEVKLEGDIEYEFLAIQPLTGGDIRNVLMNAFLNAESRPDPAITMVDLLWFARMECQKKGEEFRERSLPMELREIVASEWEHKVLEAKADPLHVKHLWNREASIVAPEQVILSHREERLRIERAMIAHQKRVQRWQASGQVQEEWDSV